ncbi:MAG: SH3 domain-containing protein [Blastochloris sp.]|nr:SH3 domain-containing protein [Blastochloris sp.]
MLGDISETDIRSLPNNGSASLGFVPNGVRVVVTERNTTGEWLRINYQGTVGWLPASLVPQLIRAGNQFPQVTDLPVFFVGP